jgi:glycosyltransferase involved in cell wall biosynthesis
MRLFNIKSLGEVVFESPDAASADVAVIIPLHNYEQHIVECLNSVIMQTLEHISVILIDDCSTDDGPALAIDFLKSHAGRFSTARVVRHLKNQGLAMARNSGISWSTEPLLFMLDADNRIRPPALERLRSALEIGGADFAYSQLFMFGEINDVGIADIWHVDRLRRRNTIDAMAMIRRAALEKAGGYEELATQGWEDYDLWCRFYTMGMRGVFVPELLCEYRTHRKSMTLNKTKLSVPALVSEITLRHPHIFSNVWDDSEDYAISIPLDYAVKSLPLAPKIAVIIHIFDISVTEEILGYLCHIPYQFDLFISTDSADKAAYIEERIKSLNLKSRVIITPRRGRDIAPRLVGFKDVYQNYEYVLLLHSKASSHDISLRYWRPHLLQHLIGSPAIVQCIFEIFMRNPDVGIVAAQHFEPIKSWLGWQNNFEFAKALAGRLGVDLAPVDLLDYPSGSMFWARTAALHPFFDAGLSFDDFQPDAIGTSRDGTMAHAIERLFFIAAEVAGLSWVKVAQPHLFEDRTKIERASNARSLRDLTLARRRHLLSRRRVRPLSRHSSKAGIETV